MKTRDKLFLMIVGAAAILVAGWMLVVSPERQQAASLSGQVSTAQQQLNAATASVAAARAAQLQYPGAYATVVTLGKAVPPGDDTASLIYQLAQASHVKGDDFSSIAEGGGTTGPGASPAPAPTNAPGSSVGAASFQAMPFSLHFNGSFFSLYHLLDRLNGFTLQSNNGSVQVSGRLLTIDGASLDMGSTATGGTGTAGTTPSELSGTLTVTAYVLPAQQSLTPGATASGPAGAPATPSSSSPATPAAAVARVTP